jgi:hypothetical protein
MLCGDLNTRTSCEVDFILNDSPRYLSLFDSYKPDDKIKLRKSHDDVLEHVDLCRENFAADNKKIIEVFCFLVNINLRITTIILNK